jgi:glucosamine-6-phosphate deaminase
MRIIIRKNYETCALWTARYIAQCIRDFQPVENKPFVLGLPTGSTPLGVYRELIQLNKAGKISFRNVVTFNMDEYVGLPENHQQSYHYFMRENFFKHIDIQEKNIHILNGMAENPDIECENYEKAIRNAGGIRLFLGGVGSDGHIAFNEPGSSLTSRTRIKTLTEETIIANSRFFDGDISKVPSKAYTVGVGTICDADEVLIMVNNRSKAAALAHAVEYPVCQMWPVSALQLHRKAVLICDDEAIVELKVGTVRYFKDIESHIPEPQI